MISGLTHQAVSERSAGRILAGTVSCLFNRTTLPTAWGTIAAYLAAWGVPDGQIARWQALWELRLDTRYDRQVGGGVMLQVLYSGDTREIELSGTREGLLAFGQLLRGEAGSCDLSENQRPFPYERSLSEIVFQEDPEQAGVSIVTEAQILRIRGRREALDLLADNVDGFTSEADTSDHCHVDSPTYDFIAPESDPLVIAFIK
ncbi:hypothetical protein GCM10010280_66410 [Streptomyces pilosus]|uniref:Uncharacterized protein n=1 Tax=Streptomyces pilosus TaxID=28893 RepID=A0A918C7C1_9ACTN|nr:hypothetical protein GCM10010280_66410 [Streptomyces pilosus]